MNSLSRYEIGLSDYSQDALTDLNLHKSILHVPTYGESLAIGATTEQIDGMAAVDLMIEIPGRSLVLERADHEPLQVTAFGEIYPETGSPLFLNPVTSLALYRGKERNARWNVLVERENVLTEAALTGLFNIVATYAPARQQPLDHSFLS